MYAITILQKQYLFENVSYKFYQDKVVVECDSISQYRYRPTLLGLYFKKRPILRVEFKFTHPRCFSKFSMADD